MDIMGTEAATKHSWIALMDLAALYARHARYGMALDCASRAVSVAVRMGVPGLHSEALALAGLISVAAGVTAVSL
jgi:hypothetical protein